MFFNKMHQILVVIIKPIKVINVYHIKIKRMILKFTINTL